MTNSKKTHPPSIKLRRARLTYNTRGYSFPSYSPEIISGPSFPGTNGYGFDEFLRFRHLRGTLKGFVGFQIGFIEAMKKQSPGYSCDIQLFTYTLTNGYEEVGVIKNCIRLTDSEISLAHAAIIGARINLVMDTYLRSGTPKIGTKIPADFINVKFDPRDIKIHASPKPLPSWKGLHRFRYSNLYR